MKKNKLFFATFLLVALLSIMLAMTACESRNNDTPHSHTYASQWTYNENYHWHKATCEHTDEIDAKAAHAFDENVCSICGYEKNGANKPEKPQEDFKTVSFDLNGGNKTFDDMQFAVGKIMSALPSPTR